MEIPLTATQSPVQWSQCPAATTGPMPPGSTGRSGARERRQRLDQLGGVDGLREIRPEADREGPAPWLVTGEARERRGGNADAAAPELRDELVAVLLGHREVGE